MEQVEVSFNDIENAIGYENMSISGGDILMDETRRTIRVSGSDWMVGHSLRWERRSWPLPHRRHAALGFAHDNWCTMIG